jgi:hypothetical protein
MMGGRVARSTLSWAVVLGVAFGVSLSMPAVRSPVAGLLLLAVLAAARPIRRRAARRD